MLAFISGRGAKLFGSSRNPGVGPMLDSVAPFFFGFVLGLSV